MAMREAFESVGIGFPFAIVNGRYEAADVTYCPKDKDEMN